MNSATQRPRSAVRWRLIPAAILMHVAFGQDAGALPDAMGSWSPVVRAEAANQVAKAGTAALPDLLEALGSDHSGRRHAATKSVAMIARDSGERGTGPWDAITIKLIDIVKTDRDFWTRCGAVSALKAIRSRAAASTLIEAASDPNPWVAAAAVDAVSGLPLEYFDPERYFATATKSLAAPRSETRSSAVKMLDALGPDGRKAMPQVAASVASFSQDSMFADRPRIDAIVWISKFDRPKAAALANGLLLEDRWGAAGRCGKLVPFLGTLGKDAAPAVEGLKRVVSRTKPKEKATAAKAKRILARLES